MKTGTRYFRAHAVYFCYALADAIMDLAERAKINCLTFVPNYKSNNSLHIKYIKNYKRIGCNILNI